MGHADSSTDPKALAARCRVDGRGVQDCTIVESVIAWAKFAAVDPVMSLGLASNQ